VDEGRICVLDSSFQHAVVRSINDKNAQLQKQLENLVREGTYSSPLLVEKPK
jgi:E3 ubiquitin-protein ligase CCNP1IP1